MKGLIIFWVIITVILCVHAKVDGLLPTLGYLGSADGKVFYSFTDSSRNWVEAKELCEGYGMSLVSITSSRIFNLFDDAFGLASGYYWTSGRDAQTIAQFSWANSSGTELDPSYLPFKKIWDLEYSTCLYFWRRRGVGSSYVKFESCTENIYTICEGRPL